MDLVGTIPTYDEAKAFLEDRDATKREKLIDKLLADPRFAAAQADVWDLVLFGRNPSGDDATRKREGFKRWLADKFAQNVPYDRWVRELLSAEEEGSELYYVQFRSAPEEAAVAVSRVLPGHAVAMCPLPRSSLRPLDAARFLRPGRLLRPPASARCPAGEHGERGA